MFVVEIYAAVRRFVFIEGEEPTRSGASLRTYRDTIAKMCRYSAPPGYLRSKALERQKLGPVVPVIDAILEADKKRRYPNSSTRRNGFSCSCRSFIHRARPGRFWTARTPFKI
jgi:hypothetical protein